MKRALLIILLLLIAGGALAGGAYWHWLHTPPPLPQTMDEALATLQSPRFAMLPPSRRDAYTEKARKLFEGLDADGRRRIMDLLRDSAELRSAVQKVQEEYLYARAREYIDADAFQRQRLLDQIIGMQELARQRRATDGMNDPDRQAQRDQMRAEMKRRMEESVERGNPQSQQYAGEFFRDLSNRRKQLGLDPDPFHGTGK